MKLRLSALCLASLLAACGGATPSTPAADASSTDAATPDVPAPDVSTPDVDVVDAPSLDAAADGPSADVPAADLPPAADAPPPTPTRCAEGEACDGFPDDAGLCPSRCVAVSEGLRCAGTTRAGLCFDFPPIETRASTDGGWAREPVSIPSEVTVGETRDLVFDVRNVSDVARPLRFELQTNPWWTVVSMDPASGEVGSVAPGEAARVTLRVRFTEPTALDAVKWTGAWVRIPEVEGRGGWPLIVPARYPEGEGARCGDRWFPEYRAGETGNYGEAACCAGVFFPGASCCASSDCPGEGRCVDGRCMSAATSVSWSATPLAGPQRVLVVLVDDDRAPSADPCTDRSAALREELGLADLERWYADVGRARVGRPVASWRWTVLAGLRSADLGLPDGAVTQEALHDTVETYLRERGCLTGFDDDYDRTVVVSPRVDLGPYAGRVFRTQRVAMNRWAAPLAAHELGHTFGATDRYVTIGGELQWASTLMARAADSLRPGVRDDVFWAEVGLGDNDRDGVIDLRQTAVTPDHLGVGGLAVSAFPDRRTLLVHLDLDVRQGGRALRAYPQRVALSLVGTDARVSFNRWEVISYGGVWEAYLFAPRDIPDDVYDGVVRDGRATVRVEAATRFTRDDFSRGGLSLDETREVTLTPRARALSAPRPRAPAAHDGCAE